MSAFIFFDTARMRTLDHAGPGLKVRGPLNIARTVQGWPDIVQAGASEAGLQLAAERAEVIFANPLTMAASRSFYADVRRRMAAIGFNVMFPWLPVGLDDVVDKLIPELQRRGLFRRDYTGRTLRDHLRLPRPANRHFAG